MCPLAREHWYPALCSKVEADTNTSWTKTFYTRWSEWATPIIPVDKKATNKVHICGDFQATVNPPILYHV